MAIIKCKMCGGDLNISEGMSVAECEYCGSTQTIPSADNEKKLTLFGRANRLLRACEFDKAAGVYETIVADFPEEAEAYWGLVLCKYGIEYVDDPATAKKIPTCHRSSFDSVMDDNDFEQALENADVVARKVYRDEAKQVEEIRKGIIEVSGREEPYDIFICYKETAFDGNRTLDSVLAQDIYDALMAKGYRVFFARISLEDKLGREYEPYIFAALNSAKVMLAIGTDYEYFNAVWVKNEWSRFLKLMESDKSRYLIPCFKNLDPYDMPKEFAKLQSQDLGKVGAIQDLLRGIEKLIVRQSPVQPIIQGGGSTADSMIMRGQFALDDGDFTKAAEYFERALDIDPRAGAAYLGKVLVSHRLNNARQIADQPILLDNNKDFQRAISFSDPETAQMLRQVQDEAKRKFWAKSLADALQRYNEMAKKNAAEEAQLRAEEKRAKEEELRRLEEERRRQEEEREKRNQAARLTLIRNRIKKATLLIAAGDYHTVGLKSDGTVVAVGNNKYGQCNVSGWTDIVAVSAGAEHTVGLKSDGTVVAVGNNKYGRCNVSGWTDIVAISAGSSHTVGLKSDGTVVAVGFNYRGRCDVDDWTNIVAISAGALHTVGLRSYGTVVAVSDNCARQRDVFGRMDIMAVSAGWSHTVGLKSNGTVVAVGKNDSDQCNVGRWMNIMAVSAGGFHTVGLKSDGTVVAVGSNGSGQCDVSGWTDIVAVSAGWAYTVGLKSDGTVVAVGGNKYGQCNVSGWKLFNSVDTLEEEREAARKAEAERRLARIAALKKEKAALEAELANLKGLFSGKRRMEIEIRLAEIERELKEIKL